MPKKTIYFLDKRFLGSTCAIIFGFFLFGAGYKSTNGFSAGGLVTILGALAYKSAKKRKLGLTPQLIGRKVLEWIAIVLIFLIVFLQKDSNEILLNHPFGGPTELIWAVCAYLLVSKK